MADDKENALQEPAFTRIIDRDATYDCLFGHCTPATIFRLGRTCQLARRSVRDYESRAFDINKRLSRYFTDPLGFRILQAQTQAVISCCTALQFMDRTLYDKSDLDIYVAWPHAHRVCKWIMTFGGKGYEYFVRAPYPYNTEAYEVAMENVSRRISLREETQEDIDHEVSYWPEGEYQRNNVQHIFNFRSTTQSGADTRYIQVIVSMRSPADCILTYHSTVVLDVITYCAAYALFPRGTFEERRGLICQTREVRYEQAIAKYERRGWDMETIITSKDQRDPDSSFRFENRWIGDRKTWVISLDTSNIQKHIDTSQRSLPLSVDPFALNSFSVTYGETGEDNARITFSLLKPVFFEHRYAASRDFADMVNYWFSTMHGIISIEQPSEALKFDRFLLKLKSGYFQNRAGLIRMAQQEQD